jgi:hypothetical protein
MVILGDDGGKYQEARNNIGVNPGNCGIGVADGQYMKVNGNKMYSQIVPGISNVGFYAMDIYDDNDIFCRMIDFYSGSNEANWTCGNPTHCESGPRPNLAHGDGECKDLSNNEMTRTYMRTIVNEVSFGSEIWNDW